MQIILNRAVRIITFAPFGRVDVSSIFKELGLLDVKSTFLLEKCKYLYKQKYDLLPITLAQHFDQGSEVVSHSYNLRSSSRSNTISTRLISSKKSIQIRSDSLIYVLKFGGAL